MSVSGSVNGLLGNTIQRQVQPHLQRTLARVRVDGWDVDGRDVGENLVAEGHALLWQDGWGWEKRPWHWYGKCRVLTL
jgi:endonuclease YncB( thermonuclease family)